MFTNVRRSFPVDVQEIHVFVDTFFPNQLYLNKRCSREFGEKEFTVSGLTNFLFLWNYNTQRLIEFGR